MKCPKCNGKGYCFVSEAWGEADLVCEQCKGKGEVDENGRPILTNEEWLKQCNTEQLAKFIFWQHFDVYGKTLYELMVNASKGVSRDKQAEVMIGAVVEWLKQPHTESSSNP